MGGLVSRLIGRSHSGEKGIEPVLDYALGDPTAQQWRRRLAAGDADGFAAYLADAESPETRDFRIFAALTQNPMDDEWMVDWIRSTPGDPVPYLVHAKHLTERAWDARTGARAKYVKDDQVQLFFQYLDRAWARLEQARAAHPEEGSIYAFMITVAKGLSASLDDGWAIYDDAQQARPWQAIANYSMCQFLAAKWHGSNDELLAFARQVTAAAPEGSSAHTVIPEAHVEVWVETGTKDAYWRDDEVRRDVIEAAARSIDSPVALTNPWINRDRNSFAFCFWKMGERERARNAFEAAGPVVAGPFRYDQNPAGLAKRARREVGSA